MHVQDTPTYNCRLVPVDQKGLCQLQLLELWLQSHTDGAALLVEARHRYSCALLSVSMLHTADNSTEQGAHASAVQGMYTVGSPVCLADPD
jgi:hypothetical protein